jgi:large subunit ribosomal protein L4
VVAQDFSVAEPRTKALLGKLKELSLDNVLVVVEAHDEKLLLAAHDKVLMTVGAVKLIEERLQ